MCQKSPMGESPTNVSRAMKFQLEKSLVPCPNSSGKTMPIKPIMAALWEGHAHINGMEPSPTTKSNCFLSAWPTYLNRANMRSKLSLISRPSAKDFNLELMLRINDDSIDKNSRFKKLSRNKRKDKLIAYVVWCSSICIVMNQSGVYSTRSSWTISEHHHVTTLNFDYLDFNSSCFRHRTNLNEIIFLNWKKSRHQNMAGWYSRWGGESVRANSSSLVRFGSRIIMFWIRYGPRKCCKWW